MEIIPYSLKLLGLLTINPRNLAPNLLRVALKISL